MSRNTLLQCINQLEYLAKFRILPVLFLQRGAFSLVEHQLICVDVVMHTSTVSTTHNAEILFSDHYY